MSGTEDMAWANELLNSMYYSTRIPVRKRAGSGAISGGG